jgi:hypothetical protein
MCCEGSFCFDGVSQCNDSNVCEACGAMGEACCNVDVCSGAGCGTCQAGACHPTSGTCTECGVLDAPCCAFGTCLQGVCQDNGFCEVDVMCTGVSCMDEGTVCRRGGCVECGGELADCCADDVCNGGSTCIATKCLPCGYEGAWCCGYPNANDCGAAECAWDAFCVGACGGEGEPCCAGADGMPPTCDGSLICAFDPGGSGAFCLPGELPMSR